MKTVITFKVKDIDHPEGWIEIYVAYDMDNGVVLINDYIQSKKCIEKLIERNNEYLARKLELVEVINFVRENETTLS